MDKTVQIERRIEKIKKALANLGDMCPGSLSTQPRSWCGQYCQLSYTHRGKGHKQYIPKEHVKDVKRQLANYRKFVTVQVLCSCVWHPNGRLSKDSLNLKTSVEPRMNTNKH